MIGMLIGILFINYLTENKQSKKIRIVLVLAGFNLWLNTDFGFAILISLLALLIIQIANLKEIFMNFMFSVIGFMIYPISLILLDHSINTRFF